MADAIGSRPVAKQVCRTEKKAGTATRRLARGRCSVYIVTSSQTGAGPLDCRGTRYRCFHLAEALRNAGYIAAVYPHDTFLEAPNPVFDIYAFHRPSAGDERLRTVVGALRKLQKTLVADIDRYIFGEQENEDETIGQARADQVRALRLFEHVTAATTALTEHAEKHHAMAEVQVITNSILPSLLGLVESQGTNLLARPDRTIGYAHWPDSATADFSAVQDVLFKTVAEDQTARLILLAQSSLQHIWKTIHAWSSDLQSGHQICRSCSQNAHVSSDLWRIRSVASPPREQDTWKPLLPAANMWSRLPLIYSVSRRRT